MSEQLDTVFDESVDEDALYDAPEQTEEQKANTPDFLEMTIQSCVLPLEFRFSQIDSPYRKAPVAFRTYTYINSVIEGVIPPEKYSFAADQTDRGVRLSKWNIGEATAAVKRFKEAGKRFDFITARVSPQIVRELDFYGFIKEILDKFEFTDPEHLCLEFPRTVLYEDREKVRGALLAMKLLKVRSMMSGFGDGECAVTPLFDLPFDYVLFVPSLVQYTTDRGKHEAMESFIAFVHSTGAKIVIDGVKNDQQLTVISRLDCYGYIPSPAYEGEFEHGRLRMPIDEALLVAQEEEEF